MTLDFHDPPAAILAIGTKEGVELGGSKIIVSIDMSHNLYTEGNIFTEMSWAEFYKEEGISDQIDTFTSKQYDSIREDPEALTKAIIKSIKKIIKEKKLFYGIVDFEVDAFLNQNTVIPGLELERKHINKLLVAHKKSRDSDLFPKIIDDTKGNKKKKIKISFQGTKKNNLHFKGSKLEDIADRLRMAKGFATGIVCSSKDAANLYIMNDRVVFKEDEIAEFYIDGKNLKKIESGIKKKELFPISWFRIDIGMRSFETLELWEKIKNNAELKKIFEVYENYITTLVINKYKSIVSTQDVETSAANDFEGMTLKEKRKALKDMSGAIKKLTKMYDE